jgi:hypothetical protein
MWLGQVSNLLASLDCSISLAVATITQSVVLNLNLMRVRILLAIPFRHPTN